ncbi:MAG: EAL domain-containing protein [Lachnospiraceae bacterium]|nr:EAL domain-containing protein [Lachnospiraceae bacterium]
MEKKESLVKKILAALGFFKMSDYEKKFHRDANVRSTVYMAAIIVVLESWMIIRYLNKYIFSGKYEFTFESFFTYTKSYWMLLTMGAIMLVYSLLYLNDKIGRSKKLSLSLTLVFTGICMYFGWTVSANDYAKGRMVLCFLTMVLYAACLLIWRPYISFLMLWAIGNAYIIYLDKYVPLKDGTLGMNEGDKINFATFYISMITVVISIYHQRHSEALKSEKLMIASVTDELTGIPNVKGFTDRAFEQLKTIDKENLVYLFINIENFKLYNDSLGFLKGNELLISLANGISELFEGDSYARLSNDHFTILTDKPDYLDRINKLQESIGKDTPDELYLTLKVGAYRPKGELEDPRLEIDRARYACTTIGHQADKFYVEYDEKMAENFKLRNYIINNIDKAVREGYIRVYYQPVVWSEDKKLCGCEALARWIDPKYGFLSPGVFIPVLEESRQIDKLDLCIYETVCRDLRERLDKGEKIFPVSLNFSRLDFELMDAIGELERLVEKYDIPRKYLHVEITESALTDDTYGLKKSMDILHEKGYSLWLDDFGSGYSSLNVLKDFNFDVLKIDMVFLKNFGDPAYEENTENTKKIICTVIDLADNLGMKTLTEGVENEACVEFLTNVGCDRLQGYYYSKPVPIDDIYKMIGEGKFGISDVIE